MPRERAAALAGEEARAAIEAFLEGARQPALLEPGEDLLPLSDGNFAIELRGERLTLQAWDRTRNLTRRVTGVGEASAGRLEMAVERFARREGRLYLLDLARRSGAEMGRRSGRLVFRERFRLFLRRQFPEWTLAELVPSPIWSTASRRLSRALFCATGSMRGRPSPAHPKATRPASSPSV